MNLSSDRHTNGSAVLKVLLSIAAIAVVGGAIYGTYVWQHQKVDKLESQTTQLNTELAAAKKANGPVPTTMYSYTSKKGVPVKVYTPAGNSQLASPVIVMGEVPGNWSFEANFPVKLLDANGNVVAEGPAQLQGDWMTDKLGPFSVKLDYTTAKSGNGTLLLQKDNPSGLETNDDSVSIPIKL